MSGGAAADAFASVKAATASEVAEMASAMTRRMHELYVGSSAAWFRLFKHMDSDGSGRVTYGEFAELVRSELEISPADLPEENLKSVWRSLDWLQRQLEALQRLNASSRSMWSTTDPNRSGTSQSARSPRLPPAGRPNTSQSARH